VIHPVRSLVVKHEDSSSPATTKLEAGRVETQTVDRPVTFIENKH